jgi:polyisoprenoid-binding protein YceI
LPLQPPSSRVELRAYGVGLIPFDGRFTRFHGWMRTDAAAPGACEIVLEVDAASLEMSPATVRDGITGPEFMDVSRFPALAFHGACQGSGVSGSLLLHGETRPFSLEADGGRDGKTIVFVGSLKRAEWGMTARRFTAGPNVRIRVEFPNPALGPRT